MFISKYLHVMNYFPNEWSTSTKCQKRKGYVFSRRQIFEFCSLFYP